MTGGNLSNSSFPKTPCLHRGLKLPSHCGIQEKYIHRILGTPRWLLQPPRTGERPRLGPLGAQDADPGITCIPPASLSLWGDELSLPKYAPTPRGWLVGHIHPCPLSWHPQPFPLFTAIFFLLRPNTDYVSLAQPPSRCTFPSLHIDHIMNF